MSDLLLTYFRGNGNINEYVTSAVSTLTQVCGRDPTRFCAILRGSGATAVFYRFLDANITDNEFIIPTGGPTIILTEETVGPMIQFPIWFAPSSGSVAGVVTTISYTADRQRQMQRYIDHVLSKLDSPGHACSCGSPSPTGFGGYGAPRTVRG